MMTAVIARIEREEGSCAVVPGTVPALLSSISPTARLSSQKSAPLTWVFGLSPSPCRSPATKWSNVFLGGQEVPKTVKCSGVEFFLTTETQRDGELDHKPNRQGRRASYSIVCAI